MLFVARITDCDKNEGGLWARAEGLIETFKDNSVDLLYLSRRLESPETSIIASAESMGRFKDALSSILGSFIETERANIFPLVRMNLFNVPENIGKEASRFLITIKTTPGDAERVYQLLSRLRPSSDIAFTYLAFISHPPSDTLNTQCILQIQRASTEVHSAGAETNVRDRFDKPERNLENEATDSLF